MLVPNNKSKIVSYKQFPYVMMLVCAIGGSSTHPGICAEQPDNPQSESSDKPKSELLAKPSGAEVNQHNVQLKPASGTEEKNNKDTAAAVNRIPGVNVQAKDLQPPAPEEPIRGFHPIKKMLQPIIRLQKNTMQLQQQIMKLAGPIASLQPSMLGLQKKMTSVESKMGNMQGRIVDVGSSIDGVGTRVDNVGSQMNKISNQMTDVRSDLSRMQNEINRLNVPLKALQKPLVDVAQPLETVDQKLEKLAALLTTVLFTIFAAAVIIAVGTPIAAILIYRNRRRLFPDMPDGDFPLPKQVDRKQTLHPKNT